MSAACSAAIASPRPLLPPWRDGRPCEPIEDPSRAAPAARPAHVRDGDHDVLRRAARCASRRRRPAACSFALSSKLREDPFEPARVGVDHEPGWAAAWSVRAGERAAAIVPTSRPMIDGFERDLLGIGVEARQLHQLLDQRPQPADVGDDHLRGAPARHGQPLEVLAARSTPRRPARSVASAARARRRPRTAGSGARRARGGGSSRTAGRPSG